MRLFLRSSEIPVIMNVQTSQTPWQIWKDMTDDKAGPSSSYSKWQSRLMVPIMQGIAADHNLKIDAPLDPQDYVTKTGIMAPKAWKTAPSEQSRGRPSALIVTQRTGQAVRDWKEPNQIPERHELSYQAIAHAYGVEVLLVGVLIDGYSSKLFAIDLNGKGTEIQTAVANFIEMVKRGEEPDLDFSKDAIQIRRGDASYNLHVSATMIDDLASRRQSLNEDFIQKETLANSAKDALRLVDNQLIAVLNKQSPIETEKFRLILKTEGKGVAKPMIVPKTVPSLF